MCLQTEANLVFMQNIKLQYLVKIKIKCVNDINVVITIVIITALNFADQKVVLSKDLAWFLLTSSGSKT